MQNIENRSPDSSSSRVKRLLSAPERSVYDGLLVSCQGTNFHVFPKVRLTDVLDIDSSGLSKEDFDYATKAHFDFVLTNKNYIPCMSIECDFLDKDGIGLEQAVLKDWICANLKMPHIRIDCQRYLEMRIPGPMADLMKRLINDWQAFKNEKNSNVDFALAYRGCLIHGNDCIKEECQEFEEIVGWLFSFHLGMDEMPNGAASIRIESESASDGYVVSKAVLSIDRKELAFTSGRCRVSENIRSFGVTFSMSLAVADASRRLQDLRNQLFRSGATCSLESAKPFEEKK